MNCSFSIIQMGQTMRQGMDKFNREIYNPHKLIKKTKRDARQINPHAETTADYTGEIYCFVTPHGRAFSSV